MLCATCPWDRNCFSPPEMTQADIDTAIAEVGRADQEKARQAQMQGRDPGLLAGTLMATLIYAGRDTSAQVCPVFTLRLRSSGGRRIADTFKGLMQDWDDSK